MILFFITLIAGQPTWEIKETHNYSPFFNYQTGRSAVAVSASGKVFILDIAETRLLMFDEDGRPAGVIAEPGDGPGELGNPLQVDAFGEYV